MFFFYCYVDHRDLHVRTHSFPTGRSSDLVRRTCPDDPAEVHAVLLPGSRGAIDPALVHRRPGRLQPPGRRHGWVDRSEEHTSELQSLMRISYAVFCLKKKKQWTTT